jgi:hypothetical protein
MDTVALYELILSRKTIQVFTEVIPWSDTGQWLDMEGTAGQRYMQGVQQGDQKSRF